MERIDVENELYKILSEELAKSIDKEILKNLMNSFGFDSNIKRLKKKIDERKYR